MLLGPLLNLLDSSLRVAVPSEPVELRGEWSKTLRKTYESRAQLGTGLGPFVEVTDLRWRGELSCTGEVSGIAFLQTESKIYWAKSPMAAVKLPVEVSLHAYAECTDRSATLAVNIGGASLPTVPVAVGANVAESCILGANLLTTGRVVTLAEAENAAFVVVVLPRSILKMGRNHLWRLRDEVASLLPSDIREVLTRRRAGVFDAG